ncbi:MAG: hypothetical protein EU535_06170 [Promethearchaeota archaeon]|nr:MAG: hypothetical protein EU535_06170 [Candidatus Lokiarchaeota archaeon]
MMLCCRGIRTGKNIIETMIMGHMTGSRRRGLICQSRDMLLTGWIIINTSFGQRGGGSYTCGQL